VCRGDMWLLGGLLAGSRWSRTPGREAVGLAIKSARRERKARLTVN